MSCPELVPRRKIVIHELSAAYADVITSLLKTNATVFHKDGDDVVTGMTFCLFHIVRIDILRHLVSVKFNGHAHCKLTLAQQT